MADTYADATCETDGCANAGIPLRVQIGGELDGEPWTASAVSCGVCGQEITNITTEERDTP